MLLAAKVVLLKKESMYREREKKGKHKLVFFLSLSHFYAIVKHFHDIPLTLLHDSHSMQMNTSNTCYIAFYCLASYPPPLSFFLQDVFKQKERERESL
jgi:hypothetical protein